MTNDQMRSAISGSLLTNAKLARALGVMMDYHLSTQEKVDVSKRIDACRTMEELSGTMNLLDSELKKGYMDPQTGDKWSPIFVRDIKKYYENGFPFNPVEELFSLIGVIKDYVIFNDMHAKLKEGETKEAMVEELRLKKEAFNESLKKMDDLFLELRQAG